MYNQSYDEYLRSVLGYNNQNDIYSTYNNMYSYPQVSGYYRNSNENMNMENLEDEYPETYRILYPMVCRVCDKNKNRQITKQLLDEMTNEIYENIEANDIAVNLNVEVRGENKTASVKQTEKREERETRQRRNPLLKDLIRILILRELGIGFPIFRPRPPFSGPGRPPFPGHGPMPGPRPPFPREYGMY